MADDRHMSFRASQEHKENKTESAMENQEEKKMTTEDAVRESAKNGPIGGIRGFFLAVVDFISQTVGTIVRNILFSERMQESMAARRQNKEDKRMEKDPVKKKEAPEKDKPEKDAPKKDAPEKDGQKGKDTQPEKEEQDKEETPKRSCAFYNERLRAYDAEITKDLAKFCFKTGQEAFTVPFKDGKITAEMFAPAFWARDGSNMVKAAVNAVLLATSLSEQTQELRVPIGAGVASVSIRMEKNEKGLFDLYVNEKPVIGNIDQEMLKHPQGMEMVIKEPLDKYVVKQEEKEIGEAYTIGKDLSVRQDISGRVQLIYQGKMCMDQFLQSSMDTEMMRQILVDTGTLTPGQAFAVSTLFSPAIHDYMETGDREGVKNPDGLPHLACKHHGITAYQPTKVPDLKTISFSEGEYTKQDVSQDVSYTIGKPGVFTGQPAEEGKIAQLHGVDHSAFHTFLKETPEGQWTAMEKKDGGFALFLHEGDTVYHKAISPETPVIQVSQFSERTLEELTENQKQSAFGGTPLILVDDKHTCMAVVPDGDAIHLMQVDETVSGHHYVMEEAAVEAIPSLRGLSQEQFSEYVNRVGEMYETISSCQYEDPEYHREEFPTYDAPTFQDVYCDLEMLSDLAIDQPITEDDLVPIPDEEIDYSDVPNYGESPVPPEERYLDEEEMEYDWR